MDEEELRLVIPYFFFRDEPQRNVLRLRVYNSETKYNDPKFEIHEREVLISSNTYKNKKIVAKIYLPVEVIVPVKSELTIIHESVSEYYELLLGKCKTESDTNGSKISDLDLISRHLSWHDNYIRENPDKLDLSTNNNSVSKVTSDEVGSESIVESLEALKLDAETKDELPKICRQSKIGSYGFASRYKNKLSDFDGNWKTGIELSNPDNSVLEDRRILRWEQERQAFDVEYYLADFFLGKPDDEEDTSVHILKRSIQFHPYWHQIGQASEKILTSHQMALLAGLPCKEFNLNTAERLEVLNSLLDIILAYTYDYRLTNGKHNSESAWNINKLSATLSWFQVHENVGEAVESFIRRSLTYPLCRCWLLSMSAFKDALEIFCLGRRQILNCLVTIYELFDDDDDRKILNELYIEDYLIWVQQVHPETIENYTKLIQWCFKIRKGDVFAELPAIEEEGLNILKEHENVYISWVREISCLSTSVRDRVINRGEISDSSSEGSSSDSEYH